MGNDTPVTVACAIGMQALFIIITYHLSMDRCITNNRLLHSLCVPRGALLHPTDRLLAPLPFPLQLFLKPLLEARLRRPPLTPEPIQALLRPRQGLRGVSLSHRLTQLISMTSI